MAKCTVCLDYDSKLNRVEPCENTGWPELDDLCPNHFTEYKIQPAIVRAYEADIQLDELRHRRYLVEVAMGLRPRPYAVGPVKGEPLRGPLCSENGILGLTNEEIAEANIRLRKNLRKNCPSTVEGTRAATLRDKHQKNEVRSPLPRGVRPSFASQIEIDEDFKEEME